MKKIVKNIYRYIKYKEHREKISREKTIIPLQQKFLNQEYNKNAKKIIVFIVPGADRITGKETMSGGVISILSIAAETKNIFKANDDVAVIVCTHSKDNLLLRYNNIENNFTIYSFVQIVTYFTTKSEVIVHTPDFLTTFFYQNLSSIEKKFLSSNVHCNIMNQNIKLMPSKEEIADIKKQFPFITITTAHQQYSTKHYREFYDVPLHKLSVWISPEQYKFVEKEDKENLLVYSPDNHAQKHLVLSELQKIEGLKIQEIKGLTYTQFKELISRAKWSLTFGEGLDGYFIEPVFSGAIAFAVYNEEFFTENFKELPTVYISYESMISLIKDDINKIDTNSSEYKLQQQKQFDLCAELYSSTVYRGNIEKFYNHQFTFV